MIYYGITFELKSVHRFLSFSRSSSNSFNFAIFLSFFRRLSSRKRCSNSRLLKKKYSSKEKIYFIIFYFVLARLAADFIPLISERVRSNGFNFDTFKI
jgi:hypothetical protein